MLVRSSPPICSAAITVASPLPGLRSSSTRETTTSFAPDGCSTRTVRSSVASPRATAAATVPGMHAAADSVIEPVTA